MPFRGTSVVHPLYPCVDEPITMRQPPTGEPCAREPHARFGGRGRRKPFPTPIAQRSRSKHRANKDCTMKFTKDLARQSRNRISEYLPQSMPSDVEGTQRPRRKRKIFIRT